MFSFDERNQTVCALNYDEAKEFSMRQLEQQINKTAPSAPSEPITIEID